MKLPPNQLPRAIDPRLYPQFGTFAPRAEVFGRGRYYPARLAHFAAVAAMPGYTPAQYVVPGPGLDTLAVNGNHEARLSLLPETYICGFSGSSAQAAGFEVQIVDLRDGSKMFNRAVKNTNLCPSGSVEGITFPVQLLTRPRIVIEPVLIAVQLKNLASVANAVQFVLWCVEPEAQ